MQHGAGWRSKPACSPCERHRHVMPGRKSVQQLVKRQRRHMAEDAELSRPQPDRNEILVTERRRKVVQAKDAAARSVDATVAQVDWSSCFENPASFA